MLAHGRWLSPGTPTFSTTNLTKTGRYDIAEILLKVALNTINQSINQSSTIKWYISLSNRAWHFSISLPRIREYVVFLRCEWTSIKKIKDQYTVLKCFLVNNNSMWKNVCLLFLSFNSTNGMYSLATLARTLAWSFP